MRVTSLADQVPSHPLGEAVKVYFDCVAVATYSSYKHANTVKDSLAL